MSKLIRWTPIGAAIALTFAMVQPAQAISGCDGGGGGQPLAISGPSTRATTFGSTVPLAGTAPELATVNPWFHQAFVAGYVQNGSATASCAGDWSSSYVANDDSRIYAASGTLPNTPAILVQIAPTIDGAASYVVPKRSTYTTTGTGTPGRQLTLHFHKAGTAPSDYSILRSVPVDNAGHWARPYVASVDYRFFATLPNGQQSQTVLVPAR